MVVEGMICLYLFIAGNICNCLKLAGILSGRKMDINGKGKMKSVLRHLPANLVRPTLRKKYFPLLNDSFISATENLYSFVFVREPFQRIVSSYNNKMNCKPFSGKL